MIARGMEQDIDITPMDAGRGVCPELAESCGAHVDADLDIAGFPNMDRFWVDQVVGIERPPRYCYRAVRDRY
jgi:hypothetical protein